MFDDLMPLLTYKRIHMCVCQKLCLCLLTCMFGCMSSALSGVLGALYVYSHVCLDVCLVPCLVCLEHSMSNHMWFGCMSSALTGVLGALYVYSHVCLDVSYFNVHMSDKIYGCRFNLSGDTAKRFTLKNVVEDIPNLADV